MADDLLPSLAPSESPQGGREITKEWVNGALLVALWGLSAWALVHLPARVPAHWNLAGEVDRWGGPLEAAFLLPGIATAVYAFILVLDWGRLDFKASRLMEPRTKRTLRGLVLLFMGALHGVILHSILGGTVFMISKMVFLMGLFFIVLGNFMPRLEPNAWVGVRIPPTLESREVWKRTHRMAGWLSVAGGALLLPLALLPEKAAFVGMMVTVAVLGIVPMVYAYVIRERTNLPTQDAHNTDKPSL